VSDVGQISDFRTLLSTLSADALTRGKQFERVTKWWLENDPIHSRQIEKVWLWDEWPEYPGRDIGIDLVARLIDGSLMAVQAKCVDESRSIPKSELDSFVSAASSSTFKHKMLVATTDGLSANAQRMLADQHVVRAMLCDLETSVDIWPSSIDHLDQHPVQPKATPRPHQQQAISGVTTGMRDHERGQLIMACGTGKTLTALWITEQLKPEVTLVLVPSLNLLSQTLSEWSKNTTTDWSYLCVCSDDTVNKSDDQPISTVDELPFEVTTNPDGIANFLKHSGTRIIFSTYQSSARVAQAQQLAGTKFNLVICDEAHRLTGKTDADYATVLDNSKIVADKRLFMTATPRTYTPAAKSKAEDRGVEITSMDDETVYGPVLHKLSFGEAIKQDLLSDYRVLIVGVTDPQVQDLIDRRELVSVIDTVTTDARTLAAHIGLAKATKDYNLKRTISFHSRIKSADQFAQDHIKILDWLPDTHKPEGTTWTGTISGAMNTGERRRLLTQLKQDDQDRHALLTNARCLTEGVDVPSLDGVAFIDPRSSQVDIIQAVGRAIRKSANKEIGTIVLPVLIPTDADVEHALEDTAFKPIWAILNALKSHDEELAIELNTLRTELGRTGKVGQLPDRLVEDLPIDIDSLLPDFLNKLSIAIIEQSTAPWEFWLGLLENYVSEHGHGFVPHNLKVGSFKLGYWVNSQRTKYKDGDLSSERIIKLEAVAGWSWNQLEDVWDSFFSLLQEFVDEFGHSLVPDKPILYREQKLSSWVNMQRTRYNRGRLEEDRIERLEALTGWTWTPINDKWDQWFALVQSFSLDTGHCRVPRGFMVGSLNLGRWVSKQRTRYNKRILEVERIERLESLSGWTWHPDAEAWQKFYDALVRYVDLFGSAAVSQSLVHDGLQLGQWVSHQRLTYLKGKIEKEKVDKLECLAGWTWNSLDASWDSFFNELKRYVIEQGSATPPQSFVVDGIQLGAWASAQRTRYNKGRLDPERIQRLESLFGWTWDTKTTSWRRFFDVLKEFTEKNGTANPSQSYVHNGIKIGAWVSGQRQSFKKGQLEKFQIDLLESLPGWTWEPLSGIWESVYFELSKFAAEFGHTDVPDNRSLSVERNLSHWVRRQRSNYKQGLLSKEQIDLLESLPGWTWAKHAESWEFYFSLLREFSEEYGHARVPQSPKLYKGEGLASWVGAQRQSFKNERVSKERIERLESVKGWVWDPLAESWEKFFSLLQEFTEENGHALVPQGTAATLYKGENLSRWVNKQRSRYNKGDLERERVEKLESVLGWAWSPFDGSWEDAYKVLIEFSSEFGHVKVPRNPKNYKGVGLATWVQSQRTNYNKGKLTQERISQLESTPGWSWNPFETLWEDSFAALERYASKTGSANPPRTFVDDGIKLGIWAGSQRQKFRKNELAKEQINRLEALPEWSWHLKSGPQKNLS